MSHVPLPPEDLYQIFDETSALWEQMRGSNVFITGGTGFFGRWLLESFLFANATLDLGATAVVLTRSPEAIRRTSPQLADRRELEFVSGDVRDFAFPPGRFPFIVHAATPASDRLNREEPLEMLDIILRGTKRVLDFAAQAGVQRFLLVSSGAIYGPQPPDLGLLGERYGGAPDPLDSGAAYGIGKRTAEQLCLQAARRDGFTLSVARCFAFVGPYLPLRSHFAIGNFIAAIIDGLPIRLSGNGSPIRSYMYPVDLVVWLLTILLRGEHGNAYNVGSEEFVSILGLAQLVNRFRDLEVPVECAGTAGITGAGSRYVPDTSKARQGLGLQLQIDLEEGIRRTLRWYRKGGEALL